MFLLDTHTHKLRFRIDANVSSECIHLWNKIKFECTNGMNKRVVDKMKTFSRVESNQRLPYLPCAEGGIGHANKQIRFRMIAGPITMDNTDDIILDQIYNAEQEKWTYEEIDDIIYSLIKTFNYFVRCDCVEGVIELTPHHFSKNKCLYSETMYR